MDEQKSPGAIIGMVAPVDLERVDEPGAHSAVVFSGDPEVVREGFIIALQAIGIGVAPADVIVRTRSNRENDHA